MPLGTLPASVYHCLMPSLQTSFGLLQWEKYKKQVGFTGDCPDALPVWQVFLPPEMRWGQSWLRFSC